MYASACARYVCLLMFFEKRKGACLCVSLCLCLAAMHSYSYLLSVLLKLSVLYFRASELSLSRRFVYLSLDLGFYVEYGERL